MTILHARASPLSMRGGWRDQGLNLRRAAELAAQMERDAVEDLLVETDNRPIVEVAGEIVLRTSWLSSPPQ